MARRLHFKFKLEASYIRWSELSIKCLIATSGCRAWPAEELAGMLLGAVDAEGSLLQSARFAFGCLMRPINQQRLTHLGIIQVQPAMRERQGILR